MEYGNKQVVKGIEYGRWKMEDRGQNGCGISKNRKQKMEDGSGIDAKTSWSLKGQNNGTNNKYKWYMTQQCQILHLNSGTWSSRVQMQSLQYFYSSRSEFHSH